MPAKQRKFTSITAYPPTIIIVGPDDATGNTVVRVDALHLMTEPTHNTTIMWVPS